MTAGAAGEPLYGREDELQVVAGLVGGLAEGAGGALVVRGEPGIGKSALLAAAVALAAAGVRVLSATGVQAEARLPFAGLHQLLQPVLPLAEQLPPRQRAALLSAFGMADAEAGRAVPDRAGSTGGDQRRGGGLAGAAHRR